MVLGGNVLLHWDTYLVLYLGGTGRDRVPKSKIEHRGSVNFIRMVMIRTTRNASTAISRRVNGNQFIALQNGADHSFCMPKMLCTTQSTLKCAKMASFELITVVRMAIQYSSESIAEHARDPREARLHQSDRWVPRSASKRWARWLIEE
jgi:hypothetical protein